jgi:Arc/MetJ family transcription regulator
MFNMWYILYVQEELMKTTVNLNEVLLNEAMRWLGETTKTAVINEALKQAIQTQKRMKLIEMAGKMNLDVDLDITRKRV